MANQPKKYKKFVATAATATLVASAIVPVASAASLSDIAGNTHEEAITALVDAKVISGYPDGTFKPGNKLTRSDVVKLLGKYLVSQGYEIPADAVSNPRFSDLKGNKELSEYAAVVADNGVFSGSNGKLLPADNITRENMAIVLVRMINTLKDVSLEEFVASQNFNGDVKDLNAAKAEARTAIQVLDFYDITNPSVSNFNPKGDTTRGQFATFLFKTINSDFAGASAVTGTVKAINNTTVEVAFGEAIDDIKSLKFTIAGLEVKNAVVKQGTNNVAVLTTAPQEGAKEYTVVVDGDTIGKFTGIAAVIPTNIVIDTHGVQGVVGKEVTLKATVTVPEGQNKAGIPVTFNVDGDSLKLNKDLVAEVYTNDKGEATYTYTQYNVANDEVIAYATGNPSKRAVSVVYWGVTEQLTIKSVKDAVNGAVASTNNAAVSYTGTAVSANGAAGVRTVYVNIAENLDTSVLNNQTVRVIDNNTGKSITLTPAVNNIPVTVDAKGNYGFSIYGANQEATPVVWIEKTQALSAIAPVVVETDFTKNNNDIAVTAAKAVFGAAQTGLTFEFDRTAQFDAPVSEPIRYKVTVKTADGKPYVNSDVKVRLSEQHDLNSSTNTRAYFVNAKGETLAGSNGIITVTTNAEGVATFYVESDTVTDHTAPQVWVDVIGGSAGVLESNEPNAIAPRVVFVKSVLADFTYDSSNDLSLNKGVYVAGLQPAQLTVETVNQNGTPIAGLDVVTYVVTNTGAQSDVTVAGQTVNLAYGEQHTFRVTAVTGGSTVTSSVSTSAATTLSIEATGRTTSGTTKFLGTKELTFVASSQLVFNDGAVNGTVAGFGTADFGANGETYGYVVIQTQVGYKYVTYNNASTYRVSGTAGTVGNFEAALTVGEAITASVTADGASSLAITNTDSLVNSQISGNTYVPTPSQSATITQAMVNAITSAPTVAAAKAALQNLNGFDKFITADQDEIADEVYDDAQSGLSTIAALNATYAPLAATAAKTVAAITAANAKVAEAEALLAATGTGTAVGEVSAADKTTLQNAITAAKSAVSAIVSGTTPSSVVTSGLNNHETTLITASTGTVDVLNAAITAFKATIVTDARVVLGTTLTQAKALISGKQDGTNPGQYAEGSVAAFQAVIDAAQLKYDATSTSNAALVAEKAALDAAITTFNSKEVKAVAVSTDATGLVLTFSPALQAVVSNVTSSNAGLTVADTASTTAGVTITVTGTPAANDTITLTATVTNAFQADGTTQEDLTFDLKYDGTKWVLVPNANFVAPVAP
jgi:trimeric autotransporter adhesin